MSSSINPYKIVYYRSKWWIRPLKNFFHTHRYIRNANETWRYSSKSFSYRTAGNLLKFEPRWHVDPRDLWPSTQQPCSIFTVGTVGSVRNIGFLGGFLCITKKTTPRVRRVNGTLMAHLRLTKTKGDRDELIHHSMGMYWKCAYFVNFEFVISSE